MNNINNKLNLDHSKNNNNKIKNISYIKIKILKNKVKKISNKLNIKNESIFILKNKISDLNNNIYENNLRYQASIENLNKRNDKYIKNIYKYSLEKIIKNLLPLVDNLKNALKTIKHKDINYEGINLTLKNFLSILKKFNVKVINDININFDPNYHQAMIVIESKDKDKDNKIIDVLQEGYLLYNRLLRPAMVKVIKYVNKK